MSKKLVVTCLMVVLFLSACSQTARNGAVPIAANETKAPGVSTQTPTPTVQLQTLATQQPSAAPSASPGLLEFAAKNSIPEVVVPQKSTLYSNRLVYEDAYNVYVLSFDLYSAGKKDGNVRQISQGGCTCFTVYNGRVYYTQWQDVTGGSCAIRVYDPAMGKSETVKAFTKSVLGICCDDGRLYFSYESDQSAKDADYPVSDLYSMALDGSGMKRVAQDVYTFGIYSNRIYYTLSSHPDGAPFYTCEKDGGKKTRICDWIDGDFQVGNEHMAYDDGKIIVSSLSGQKKELPQCSSFAMLGQYVLCSRSQQSGGKTTWTISAYDMTVDQNLEIAAIGDIGAQASIEVLSTEESVFLAVVKQDQIRDLYRMGIQNGKAVMERIASLNDV